MSIIPPYSLLRAPQALRLSRALYCVAGMALRSGDPHELPHELYAVGQGREHPDGLIPLAVRVVHVVPIDPMEPRFPR